MMFRVDTVLLTFFDTYEEARQHADDTGGTLIYQRDGEQEILYAKKFDGQWYGLV